MGWDAFATRDGKDLERAYDHRSERDVLAAWTERASDAEIKLGATQGNRLTELWDTELREAFARADTTARALGDGQVDGLLRDGGLDCSACADALQSATQVDTYGAPWPPPLVRQLAKDARWGGDGRLTWAEASAKAFLETCAELGLGLRFSW